MRRTYYGPYTRFDIECGTGRPFSLQASSADLPDAGLDIGDPLAFDVDPDDVMVFPGDDQEGEL